MNLSFSPKTLTRKENEREKRDKGERKVESQPRARRHINRGDSVEEAARRKCRGPCKGKNLKKISKAN